VRLATVPLPNIYIFLVLRHSSKHVFLVWKRLVLRSSNWAP
ncbi:unnamed protein product, partial [Larinioides sclopetarius]